MIAQTVTDELITVCAVNPDHFRVIMAENRQLVLQRVYRMTFLAVDDRTDQTEQKSALAHEFIPFFGWWLRSEDIDVLVVTTEVISLGVAAHACQVCWCSTGEDAARH